MLYINGGEPNINKTTLDLLTKLVESGRSKDVTLWYNINCTMLPNCIRTVSQFKEARICLSIDDLEDRNAFIRTSTDWNAVLRTIETLKQHEDKLTLRITQTVSAYNYATLSEFEWAQTH